MDIQTILTSFESKWGTNPNFPNKINNFAQLNKFIINNANIKVNDSIDDIQNKYKDIINNLSEVYHLVKKENTENDLKIRINRLIELIYYSQHMMIGYKRMMEVMDVTKEYTDNSDMSLLRFSALDEDDTTPFQKLLLYLLEYTHYKKYARYHDGCYKEIYKNGKSTYAWEYVYDIQTLIYESVQKNINFDKFKNFTHSGNNVKNAIEYLKNCVDVQFPQLNKNRYIFSFKNGIYIAKYYDNDGNLTDKFIKYEDVKGNVCSAKYFDHEFEYENESNWENIKTPTLDSILEYQEISKEVMNVVYIFIGRLIYEINELDGWQVIFFFQGQAGTGKSTLTLNVCKNLYDEEDCGVISNNIQKKFGLADIVSSLIYVAPEIKRDFSMEQGEFQSIVSGDKVTINIKHQKSEFLNWKIPGIMAGNEVPDFIDNSGSIQRRIITLKFDKRVKNSDTQLGVKLDREMHAIIKKCNLAYHEAVKSYGNENIWNNIPSYYKNTQSMLAQATNPLIHFMESGKIRQKLGSYIPEKVFIQEFNTHCNENNYVKHRFNPDFYMGPFSTYNIKVIKNVKRRYPENIGKSYTGTFFENIELVMDEDEEPI